MIAPELVFAGTTLAGLVAASHAFHSWLADRKLARGNFTLVSELLARHDVALSAKLDDRMDEMRSVVDAVQASQDTAVKLYIEQSKETKAQRETQAEALKTQRADLEKLMQENFAALASAHNSMAEKLQKLEAGSASQDKLIASAVGSHVVTLTAAIDSVRDERAAHEAKLDAALGKLAVDWRQKIGEIEHAMKATESNVDHKLAATEAAGLPRYKGFNRG